MTQYQRITGKVFGGNATATGNDPQIAQFGSALANTFVGTTDPATIQQLPAWGQGWIGAVTPETQFPPLPEMTGAMKVLSHQICGILQQGVSTWDSGTIYYTGNFVSLNGRLYISQVDENQGNNPATDTTNWQEFSSGGGLEIGDIGIAPLGIDETKGKRRYLNGQIIIQDQYTVFSEKVKSAIALYPTLGCTEQEWQTIATMSVGGQVGKFVVDNEGGTIRLPKIIMPIQGLTDLSKLAEIVEAGLPNIEGKFSPINAVDTGVTANGAFKVDATWGVADSNNGGSKAGRIALDASLSNSIYGNSDTVQQEQIQYPYFIQVATGSETEDNIINEIELNNPFSLLEAKWSDKLLNNVSWLRSQGQANSKAVYNDAYDLILREYNNGTDETETVSGISITFRRGTDTNIKVTTDKSAYDSILAATGTAWYYVLDIANENFYLPQSDGFFQFGGDGNFVEAGLPNITGTFGATNWGGQGATGAVTRTANGTEALSGGGGLANTRSSYKFNASRSSSIYGNSDTVQPNAVKGYLYFYVGETVQNANLINAGRIEEKIASLIPDNSSLISGYPMPSNKYIDLTLGASGTQYTAPANGWIYWVKLAGSDWYYINVRVLKKGVDKWQAAADELYSSWSSDYRTNPPTILIPIKKGYKYETHYNATGKTVNFRFIYAEGEQ